MKPNTSLIPTNDANWLTKKQLAARIGVGDRCLDALVASGKIPFMKLGHKTLRFCWPRVEAALAKFEVKAATDPRR